MRNLYAYYITHHTFHICKNNILKYIDWVGILERLVIEIRLIGNTYRNSCYILFAQTDFSCHDFDSPPVGNDSRYTHG